MADLNKIIDELFATVVEAAELSKAEEKWGVTAAAPVAAAPAGESSSSWRRKIGVFTFLSSSWR